MKKLSILFFAVCTLACISLFTACSDNEDDEMMYVTYGTEWRNDLECTEGALQFDWEVSKDRYYRVSYDFTFEDKICTTASFTVCYRSAETALDVWNKMSDAKKAVCVMTDDKITYPDQHNFVGRTFDEVVEEVYVVSRSFEIK